MNIDNFENPIKNIKLEIQDKNSNIQIDDHEENKFDDKLDITEICDTVLLLEEQVFSVHNRKSETNQYYELSISDGIKNSNNLMKASKLMESKGLSFPIRRNNSDIPRFTPIESHQTPKSKNSLITTYRNNTFINISQIALSSSQSTLRGIVVVNINKIF